MFAPLSGVFSKKPKLAVQTAAPAAARARGPLRDVAALVADNPYIGAGAAALLLLLSLGVLLLVGDPKAGSPSVRVALSPKAGEAVVAGVTPQGEFLGVDPLTASLDGAMTSETPGEAIITLPGGGTQVVATGGQALTPAPIAGLAQQGPGGLLPIIAPDGRTSATAYARPFVASGKPKVGLVIGGLGINPTTTRQVIESLPPEVTLSFAVYADDLQGWIDLARAHGHEVLLETPMEPNDYPSNDPGPYTLMAASRPEETVRRLDQVLAKATGYFGVTNYMGSRFVTSAPGMTALTSGLKRRGLAFIDDGSAARFGGGLPRASAERIIDDQLGPEAISRHLTALEAGATARGQALGAGFAYQVTVQQVRTWAQGLPSRGYQLAPASALMVRR